MPAHKSNKPADPVVTLPDIDIVLDAEPETGYTRLVASTGHETTVPDSLVESLLDSGYTKA